MTLKYEFVPVKREPTDYEEALETWAALYYSHNETDRNIGSGLRMNTNFDWLRRARKALFLTTQTVASRAGMKANSYQRLERSEHSGRVTIASLKRCAEAMDCELVYFIRPKAKIPFAKIIGDKLYAVAQLRMKQMPHARYTVGKVIRFMGVYMCDPRFRRSQGWSKNDSPQAQEITYMLNQLRRK